MNPAILPWRGSVLLSAVFALLAGSFFSLQAFAQAYPVKPLRLIVPGWYGVANVKWIAQVHVLIG